MAAAPQEQKQFPTNPVEVLAINDAHRRYDVGNADLWTADEIHGLRTSCDEERRIASKNVEEGLRNCKGAEHSDMEPVGEEPFPSISLAQGDHGAIVSHPGR